MEINRFTFIRLFPAAMILSLSLLASASAQTHQAGASARTGAAIGASTQDVQTIRITRSSSQPPQMSSVENFIGSVGVEPLLQANEPSRLAGARVTFAAGARAGLPILPLGLTLIVIAGAGVGEEIGGSMQVIIKLEVVRKPPI